MARSGCSFKEAVSRLGGQFPDRLPPTGKTCRTKHREPVRTPDPDWLRKAESITRDCAKALASPAALRARVWLINRGLKLETLSRRQVGYNPNEGAKCGLWLERGITIPWLHQGDVTAINVRRPQESEKYKLVKGSFRKGLFLGDQIVPGRPSLLVEGEFDALLGWQIVRDLVNVATLGSATTKPDSTAIRQLVTSPLILVAYDSDPAGRQGADYWLSTTARVHRVPIPSGKDLTEFHQRGGDIALWLRGQLRLAGYRAF
jgi:DNA primase